MIMFPGYSFLFMDVRQTSRLSKARPSFPRHFSSHSTNRGREKKPFSVLTVPIHKILVCTCKYNALYGGLMRLDAVTRGSRNARYDVWDIKEALRKKFFFQKNINTYQQASVLQGSFLCRYQTGWETHTWFCHPSPLLFAQSALTLRCTLIEYGEPWDWQRQRRERTSETERDRKKTKL